MLHCLSHSYFFKKEQHVDFTEGIVGLHYAAHSMDRQYCHYTALFSSPQITMLHSLNFLLLLLSSSVSKTPLIPGNFSRLFLSGSFISHPFLTQSNLASFKFHPYGSLRLFKKWFLPVAHNLYSPTILNITVDIENDNYFLIINQF